jgi:protein FAM32A
MPGDEYSSVVRGGLKLKGGVTKKKKKSKPKSADAEGKKDAIRKALEDEDTAVGKEIEKRKAKEGEEEVEGDGGDRELEERGGDGKTASERAYEEMRRKRVSFVLVGERGEGANWEQLHERLQKEGVKTHKEKVEELNKYLSNLSEHHDM